MGKNLDAGNVIILDGATGSELQKRGARMDDDVWCATANYNHPDIVRAVHADYIRAGADIITANTFATSPLLFHSLGRSDEVTDFDRVAIRLAREAVNEAADRTVAIAGSFSVMRPVSKGGARTGRDDSWTPKEMIPLMQRKAHTLAEAGCDFIIMEMLRDIEQSLWATEAAVETGLPVWVGISVERREDGRLAGYGDHQWTLEDMVPVLMATGAKACLVMHHDMSLTADALQIIKSGWAGPVGTYPEAGHFEMPQWQFKDISTDDFVAECIGWRRLGATILGGCCGFSPEHIAALAKATRQLDQ